MIAAWPWASLAPLNPLRAIFSFAHFHYEIRTIVAGEIYRMADVPWWYVPFYLAIKVPLVILPARCASPLWYARPRDEATRAGGVETAFIAFVALFPVLRGDHGGAGVYRHAAFLFVVPPLAVLAGIGFDALLPHCRRGAVSRPRCGAVLVARVECGVLVRLHPYEYMFYNPLVGGLEGAARRYEMDYWVNVMPDAVHALAGLSRAGERKSQRVYTVGVCGEKFSFENYADKRLQATPGWLEADFFLAPTHMNCDRLVDGTGDRDGSSGSACRSASVKDRRGLTQKALNLPFDPTLTIKAPAGEGRRALDPRRARGRTRCGSPGRLGRPASRASEIVSRAARSVRGAT